MRQRSFLIGRIIGLYCEGRAHARRAHKRHRRKGESEDDRAIYLLGHHDERERIRVAGRLAQLELLPAANLAESASEAK